MLVEDDQYDLISWAEKNGNTKYRNDANAIGWEKNGEIVAVVVMDTWSDGDCNVHIVSNQSRTWFSHAFIAAVFTHLFIELGLRRVTGLVPIANYKAIRFDLKLGFVVEGICRKASEEGDVAVLGMLKEECRWIRGVNHG